MLKEPADMINKLNKEIDEELVVLIIDDNLATCEELQLSFGGAGIKSHFVNSLALAREMIRSEPKIGVVLTDEKMPGESGADFLNETANLPPSSCIKTIVMTAFSNLDHAVKCFRRGAFDYLAKPLNRVEVIAKVRLAIKTVSKIRQTKAGIVQALKNIQKNRAARSDIFKNYGFSQIGWDCLIQLTECRLKSEKIDVTGLCSSINADRSTVWRRIRELEQLDLVTRSFDENDMRRVYISISDEPFEIISQLAADTLV